MKALACGLLLFPLCLALAVRQATLPPADANIVDAITWYDSLGFPDTSRLPYVRVATGNSIQFGNQPAENTYVDGFLLHDDAEAFSILVSGVQSYPENQRFFSEERYLTLSVRRFVKKADGPPERRVAFEGLDFGVVVDAYLERLAAARSLTSGGWRLSPRAKTFAVARACLQRGLITQGSKLIAIAAGIPDPDNGKPLARSLRDQLQREMGDAAWWAAEEMFGDTDVSWADIVKTYDDFPARYPASPRVPQAQERTAALRVQLREMGAHRALAEPMPPVVRAKEAVEQLQNLHVGCWWASARYPLGADGADGPNVLATVHRLVDLGDAAVPLLIEALDDQRFTRSIATYCAYSMLGPPASMRVSDFAQRILEFESGRRFSPQRAANGAPIAGSIRPQAEAWWAEKQAKGEKQVLLDDVAAGGQSAGEAVRRIVERYPEAGIEAINVAMRGTDNNFVRARLVELAARLPAESSTAFLRLQLAPDAGIPSQVAAATILLGRGQRDVISVIVDAWRGILPRLPVRDAFDEAGKLITFLANSGDADAIVELERGMRGAPVDVRLAGIRVFRAQGRSSGGSSIGRGVSVEERLTALPAGPAGAAIEHLLIATLDDTERRFGTNGTYDEVSFEDPRVSDMAAFVLSKRWPAKYQFRWSPKAAECDPQIDVIRSTWRASNGLVPLPRAVATNAMAPVPAGMSPADLAVLVRDVHVGAGSSASAAIAALKGQLLSADRFAALAYELESNLPSDALAVTFIAERADDGAGFVVTVDWLPGRVANQVGWSREMVVRVDDKRSYFDGGGYTRPGGDHRQRYQQVADAFRDAVQAGVNTPILVRIRIQREPEPARW